MNDQQIIDHYLLDELDVSARAAFEQRLTREPELADTVRFHQALQTHFAQNNTPLTETLQQLGKEFFPSPPTPRSAPAGPDRRWWALLLLLPLAALLYWWTGTPTPPAVPETAPTERQQNTPPTPDEAAPLPPSTRPVDEDRPALLPEVRTPQPTPTPRRPIAALDPATFAPNPVLEGLLNEDLRAGSTDITTPANGTKLTVNNTLLQFGGTTPTAPPYTLSLYTNRPFDFDNDYPVLRRSLDGTTVDGKYRFDFRAQLQLAPGRYYLVLQDKEAELLGGRWFEVR